MKGKEIGFSKLNEEQALFLEKRTIICYEKSISYLKELKAKYPKLIKNIVGIIDDYKRNQGEFIFDDRSFLVSGSELLEKADWSNTSLLIMSDYFYEAYEKLVEYPVIAQKADTIYYFINQETEYELEFREKYQNCELQDIIVFRSGPHASAYVRGMDFSDNARALFEYMLKQKLDDRYELVWMVKNPAEFADYESCSNVKFVSFEWSASEDKEERKRYYKPLCLAKYLFFTDAYGFARNCREDQIRVQLWHGCGFKTRVNFVRCEKRYEYTTVISDLYAKIHADIYGLRTEQVLVAGYPKEDWLFHPIAREKFMKLGIPNADKYIFWLPTFRTTEEKLGQLNEYRMKSCSGLPILDTVEKLEKVNTMLSEYNMMLVIKLHPFQKADEIKCKGFSNIHLLDNNTLLRHDVQINQLLGHADALLSDYSSAAVDYLVLDRPIGFTLDDIDRYADSRGFVFNNIKEWLPGSEIYEFAELTSFIDDIGNGIDLEKEKRRKIRHAMHNFADDRNSERIVRKLGIV